MKAVDSLFLQENCDVYITGSNAYFISGELATLLTGRYVEVSMMPLSFKEYCEGIDDEGIPLSEKFNRYIANGPILENIVYLELRRRYAEVYVGQMGTDGEVDFVAIEDGMPVYYHVAQTTIDDNVLARELAPLRQIKDNYPKYLLTLDELFGEMNYDGIRKENALTWLLS